MALTDATRQKIVDHLIEVYERNLNGLQRLTEIGFFEMQQIMFEMEDPQDRGVVYTEMIRELIQRQIPFDVADFEREEVMH